MRLKISDIVKAARLNAPRDEQDLLKQLAALADAAERGEKANEAQHQRTANVLELVNQKMDATGCGYDEAWRAICNERPELFKGMVQPAGSEALKPLAR